MNKTYLTLLLTLLSFSACSKHVVDPEMDFKPPEYIEQLPSRETDSLIDSSNQGSLFGQGDNPLFSDHKAMHVYDIVTIVISENAQSTTTKSKNLASINNTNLGGGVFAPGLGAGGTLSGLAGTLTRGTDVGFTTNSTSTFNGTGTANLNNTFTTTVSARVVKILGNGNYFISGRREILIDGEKQIIQLSGVIRPFDIDQNNQINSAQMADAKIMYKTEGDIQKAAEQGWGTKLLETIWPF
ncbi:flagellar basal body L-ring protein FlgH [Sulfurimonas sp. MAG313]|nr:flagellar basal body L-ring protein FlgH [Sulfurimonas sp. MAG313]MDF1881899.1 flagellar basal body L-ring protein FlgH [Sulfurimonas sp. MAG313]